jgi:multiple sugar transport system permease protein
LFSVALQRLGITSRPIQFIQNYDVAFLSILVIVTWRASGFTMLLLLTGIQSIPLDVQEAARIDGASCWQRFRLVTLPLIRRTLSLAMIMSITGSILAFDQFYIITMGAPRNMTITAVYHIYRTSFISFRLGYGSALSVVLMVILIVFTLFQFFFLRGRKESNA